jgi:two-component system OmpR family sensor kinase
VKRRLTFAIIGTVIVTLVLAGIMTLAFAAIEARRSTERDLRGQVADVADGLRELSSSASDNAGPVLAAARQQAVLRALRRTLRLEGAALMVFGPGGNTTDPPPAGVSTADLDLARLRDEPGLVVSGNHGSLVWAATSVVDARRGSAVLVLTESSSLDLGPTVRWFLLASAATVLLGALVAARLSKRLTQPLREADVATQRIASGDLSTRVPVPEGDDEVADLARSINSMAGALERSKGLEQQFLLSVSHDLRTPLTSIRGYAEAIADGTTRDPRAAGEVILTESRRLERLVRDLLDLARLESRQFTLDQRPVDLVDVATATVDGFRPDADTNNLALTMSGSSEAIVVQADPDRLAQVVANLVDNALKYARTSVAVGVSRSDRDAVLVVDDDGPGIATEDLPHVFERLYVSRHEPVRRETGSGLGLAIVRELVEAMGGSIAAQRAPNGGARMIVRLPAA